MTQSPGTTGFAALALALVVVGFSPTSAAADTTVSRERRLTSVSAHGDLIAWSSYDVASRRYRLVARSGGVNRVLPVRSRAVPFDVDLGPDASGRTVAAYSRCRREPSTAFSLTGLPSYAFGRGCDVYVFDFDSARELKVRAASGGSSSEFLPSVWGNRIAFGRVYERREGLAGHLPYLYVSDLRREQRSRRLRGGRRPSYECFEREGGPDSCAGGPGPVSLDLLGRRVAYTWVRGETCEAGDTMDAASELLLESTTGRRTRIGSGCEPVQFRGPTIFQGSVHYFLRRSVGSELRAAFGRFDPSSRRTTDEPAPLDTVSMSRADSGTVYVENLGRREGVRIVETSTGL